MTWLTACLGGFAGALAIEVSELHGAIRSAKGFPWKRTGEVPLVPYLISVVLRIILGVAAAWFCATAGPLGMPGAVAAGVAAPKLLEELGRRTPIAGTSVLASGQLSVGSARSYSPAVKVPVVPEEGE